MNITDEKLIVYKNMKEYGGSFVRALAECIILADEMNLYRIQNTFGELWEYYLNV